MKTDLAVVKRDVSEIGSKVNNLHNWRNKMQEEELRSLRELLHKEE